MYQNVAEHFYTRYIIEKYSSENWGTAGIRYSQNKK